MGWLHGNSFNSADIVTIAVLIIHANSKHSMWYLISSSVNNKCVL